MMPHRPQSRPQRPQSLQMMDMMFRAVFQTVRYFYAGLQDNSGLQRTFGVMEDTRARLIVAKDHPWHPKHSQEHSHHIQQYQNHHHHI